MLFLLKTYRVLLKELLSFTLITGFLQVIYSQPPSNSTQEPEATTLSYPEPTNGCSILEYLCKDGFCAPRFDFEKNCDDHGGRMCENTLEKFCPGAGCIDSFAYDISQFDCKGYCGKCPDGSCTVDGKTCPGVCPSGKTLCQGSCEYTSSYKCHDSNTNFHSCASYEKPCDFSGCYSESERCNGYSYCDDGSDEEGCPTSGSSFGKSWYILAIIGVIIVIVIIASHRLCRRRRNTNFSGAMRPTQTTTSNPIIAVTHTTGPNTGAAHFSGTRMQPVYPIQPSANNPPNAYWQTNQNQVNINMPSTNGAAPPAYQEAVDSSKFPPSQVESGQRPGPGMETPPPAYNPDITN